VVFVQFRDDDAQDPRWQLGRLPDWSSQYIAADTVQPFPQKSVTQYFYDMSRGRFLLIGDAYTELVITKRNHDDYIKHNEDYGVVNREVLSEIDKKVDFARFDNWSFQGEYTVAPGKDGKVDMIIMIYRRTLDKRVFYVIGESSLGYFGQLKTDDGVIIDGGFPGSGLTQSKGLGDSRFDGLETAVRITRHEFSHKLFGAMHFIDNFAMLGLMSSGNGGAGMHSYEKKQLGWMQYITPTPGKDTTVFLNDYMTTDDACAIQLPSVPTEYFIIENRQGLSEYDEARSKGLYVYKYDGFGLMIESANGRWDWKPDTALGKVVRAVPNSKGGNNQLERVYLSGKMYFPAGWDGDEGDAFSPERNKEFSLLTNPAALTWRGEPSGVELTNLRREGEALGFDIRYRR
jgi:M6 family metalloprotease-like protein